MRAAQRPVQRPGATIRCCGPLWARPGRCQAQRELSPELWVGSRAAPVANAELGSGPTQAPGDPSPVGRWGHGVWPSVCSLWGEEPAVRPAGRWQSGRWPCAACGPWEGSPSGCGRLSLGFLLGAVPGLPCARPGQPPSPGRGRAPPPPRSSGGACCASGLGE